MKVADQIVQLLYPPGTVERPATQTSAYRRLRQMIFEDKNDLVLILIYTFFSGLFSLSIPLATQIVVNTIAAGVFLQPLTVIAGSVLSGLCFVAVLRLLTLWIVEQIRQRTFARVTLRLAYRVPRVRHAALAKEYLPELVNRFFDTITVQSGWFNFLLDAPAAALQVLVGLALLALYSPWLLLFDLIVIAFFLLEVFVLGYGGFRTRTNETTQRFLIAEWLEELARCETGIKTNGIPPYLLEQADKLLVEYIRLRRIHFRVLFRQAAGLFFFQSIASAAVLGVGGYLVIHRELAMGQLVASLLIVNMVMPALERVVRNMQNVYELLSALNKIGYVEDLPLERKGGAILARSSQGARLDLRGLRFAYTEGQDVLCGVDLSLNPGDRISLFGPNGSGKTTLSSILCGLIEPTGGLVQINGVDIRDIDLDSLRSVVALMGDGDEIFPGTIIDNISLGRKSITHLDVMWALDLVQFNEELSLLPNGLQTVLTTGGGNLSRGQTQKLMLARAIVKRPQLLILDEAFTAIEERSKLEILDRIYSANLTWTIIDISHDADSIHHSNKIVLLAQGKVVESGTAAELIKRVDGRLEHLFPQLVQMLRIINRSDKDDFGRQK
jgi:ABC-type bacteriocin/lantibiotic exporter with double-glycine peptidase domain